MNCGRLARAVMLVAVVGCLVGSARPATAQIFISPLVGVDFGGDSGCAKVTSCGAKKVNVGFTFGHFGDIFGFEEEVAFAKDFYGSSSSGGSSVFTLMTNVMVAPKVGAFRPYALVGAGLMKSNAEFGALSALTSFSNTVGWNLGGGVFWIGETFGVRGDIRYFHGLKALELGNLQLGGIKLDFGRAAAALVIVF